MISTLREIFSLIFKPALFLSLGWNDILKRYRRSLFGPFWITLTMLIQTTILSVIFSKLLGQDINFFVPYLCLGLIIWAFISNTLTEATSLFVDYSNLIKQVKISLFLHVLRLLWRNIIIFLHNLAIVPIVFYFFDISYEIKNLFSILGYLLLVLNLSWIVALVAIISARFRDVQPIVNSLLNLFFYSTPIMWNIELIKDSEFYQFIVYNPFYQLLSCIREPLLPGYYPDFSFYLNNLLFIFFGWIFVLLIYKKKIKQSSFLDLKIV